jgi:ketosteroid isomerase-like protein
MSIARSPILAGAGFVVASAGVPTKPGGTLPARAGVASDPDVEALFTRAARAHAALMVGDVARYRELIQPSEDFTLMPPYGGPATQGAHRSDERWEAVARFFKNGEDSTVELVQAYRSDEMVVLALIERTHAEIGGLEAQDWALRVTLVFRRESDRWQLVHRHADPLVEGISLKEAAAISRRRSTS